MLFWSFHHGYFVIIYLNLGQINLLTNKNKIEKMASTCNAWMLSAPFKWHVERPKRSNHHVVQNIQWQHNWWDYTYSEIHSCLVEVWFFFLLLTLFSLLSLKFALGQPKSKVVFLFVICFNCVPLFFNRSLFVLDVFSILSLFISFHFVFISI